MLKILRKKENAKKVLWLLAIIIVPAFVLWGSSSLISNRGKENFAGKIFGKKVSFEQFNDAFQAVKTQAMLQFGDNFYKVQKFLNLESETWDRLILLHEVHKHKIKVPNKEVIEAIKKYSFFQRNGQFDPVIYQDILTYSLRLTARDFEEQIRLSLSFVKLFDRITKNITVNSKELLEEYKKANEKVKVSYLLFSPVMFEKNISVDSAAIKDYYEKHKSDFKQPPSINIQYVGLDFSGQPTSSEKRETLDKLTLAAAELKKDPDFGKIAEKFGLQVKETGFFSPQGPVPAIGWSNEFLEAAFNLNPQEISQPVETNKGIYILKLKETKDAFILSLAEAEAEIKKIIIFNRALGIAEEKANAALAQILKIYKASKKIDFSSLAKSLGIEVKTTPLFKYGEYIPSIGVAKELQDAAFKLSDSQDKVSDIISLPQGFFILKLDDFRKIDEKKFAEEKDKFKDALLESKKRETFNSYFQRIKKEAKLHSNLPKLSP